MRAVKGNKEYAIDGSQQKSYQDSGFDIVDDDGQVVAYGRGKTVPYDEYAKAIKEIERLRTLVNEKEAENAALREELAKKPEPARKAESKKVGE